MLLREDNGLLSSVSTATRRPNTDEVCEPPQRSIASLEAMAPGGACVEVAVDTSAADELAKLADLHDRGVLTDKEFDAQKRALLDENRARLSRAALRSPRSLIALVAVVLVAGALTAALFSSSPSATGPQNVKVETVAATASQVQDAISYAEHYVGTNHDDGYCLQFVAEAWRAGGITLSSEPSAAAYWNADPNGFPRVSSSSYGTPPAGALLFWGARSGWPDGHVAISLGDGTAISTSAYPYYGGIRGDPRVFHMTLSQRSPTTYNYVGYLMPGGFPAPSPVAAPTTTTTHASSSNTSPAGGSALQPAAGSGTLQPASGAGALNGGGSISVPSGGSSTTHPTSGASAPTTAPTTTSTSPPATTTPPTSPPSPQTYAETVGGVSHTWTNYTNAGGTEGPSIAAYETVQIACKLTGFKVADGNTWWYRIAQSPWNDAYYVSADAFYNNGATSGSLSGTPWVDPAVPNC